MRTVLTLLVSLPTLALAQPIDLYGLNPRSISMAGVQAAADRDFSAAYYNPALLNAGSAGFGFHWGAPFVSIEQSAEPLTGQELSAERPVDYTGFTFGASIPLIGLLKDKATLGIAGYVPRRHVFRSHMIDEGTAYFLRYDNAPERFQLALSAAARPVEWLSVGAGAQVVSDYGGYAEFNAVLGTGGPGRVIRRRLESEVTGAFGPIVGVAAGPFKNVRVFGFWRGEIKTTFSLPISVDLGTFGALDVTVRGITQYAPHTAGLGASITLLDERLLIAIDGAWEHWSSIPPLVPQIAIALPQTLRDLGFDKDVLSRDVEMNFRDTITPRLGVEWRQGGRLRIRGGYYFRPTPVPDQSGRTNFLDSHAHVLSAGAGWSFDDPLQMARALTLDTAAQLTVLSPREVVKEGPNRNPNYKFGGSHLSLSLAAKYEF